MLTLSSLILAMGPAVAQSPEFAPAEKKSMNNDAIAKMIKAGLSDYIILKTINANPGSYDVSTEALNALKAAGAGDRVISAILRRSGQSSSEG